jgi:hypothetical protein
MPSHILVLVTLSSSEETNRLRGLVVGAAGEVRVLMRWLHR